MVALVFECAAAEKDQRLAQLWERGTTGVIEEDLPGGRCLLRAFFDHADATIAQALDATIEPAEERDWIALAQSAWQPVLVGTRFFLTPPWDPTPAPAGRLRLEFQPGRACGTGAHPATQLCLEALEQFVQPPSRVLDLGTGSGILALAATLLGAKVFACDIDAEAIAAAGPCFVGSARAVRSASIDLVVANINAAALVSLAADIRRITRPGGAAILAGFREPDLSRITQAMSAPARQVLTKDGWLCAAY